MKALWCAAVVALMTVGASAQETKLGTGVTLKEATPVKAVVERPADFVGKTIRIDGIATAVCEDMGCWLAVASTDDPTGPTLRLKVEDGVIVFPLTAKGRKVSAQGVFEEIAAKDAHGKEAAAEHAKHTAHKHDPKGSHDAKHDARPHEASVSKKFHIKATGAVIK